jgi:hypothetical protein
MRRIETLWPLTQGDNCSVGSDARDTTAEAGQHVDDCPGEPLARGSIIRVPRDVRVSHEESKTVNQRDPNNGALSSYAHPAP